MPAIGEMASTTLVTSSRRVQQELRGRSEPHVGGARLKTNCPIVSRSRLRDSFPTLGTTGPRSLVRERQ